MLALVAEDDLASRVLVETALRERGFSVRNCEDGLQAAKILSGTGAPRLAVLSNSLVRLRGLDICRFLCAVGKKQGVYVILLSDMLEMELIELCRRAGVDDVVTRPVAPVLMALRLDVALRFIRQEDEMAKVQGALKGLAGLESSADRRARELREANAALLKTAKPAAADAGKAPAQKQQATPSAAPAAVQRHVRSLNIVPGEKAEEAAPAAAAPPAPAATASTAAPAPHLPEVPASPVRGGTPAAAVAFVPPEDDSDAAPAAPAPEDAHEVALSGAEQFQNEELADEDRVIYPFEFDEIVINVFSGMGVTLKTEIPAKPLPEGPVYLAWVGIGMHERGSWLDVLLLAGERGAQEVTKALLGEATVSDSDICEMLAELQNMTQGALRRHMEESGAKLVQIAIPKARELDELPTLPQDALVVESGFSFAGEPINALLFEHRDAVERAKPTEAELYDLICDNLQDGDGKALDGVPAGSLIRAPQMKLLADAPATIGSFRVVRPSSIVRAMRADSLLS